MRFMSRHKNDPRSEAGEKPPMELVAKMGEFIGEHAKAGSLIDGAGLGASSTRTRLTFRDGACTVKRGPYRGEHELPATMLLLKVKTRDEAIGWAERYGKILGTGEIELGKVNEPWDIGLMPAPENPPLQILLVKKGDQASESGARSGKQKADLTRLRTEMTKAGVLVRTPDDDSQARRQRIDRGSAETLDAAVTRVCRRMWRARRSRVPLCSGVLPRVGTRLAVLNSQPGADVSTEAPMPSWGWGVVGGPYVK